MSKVKVGEIYELKEGGSATVIEYEHSDRVLIRHNDNYRYEQRVQAGHLKRGNVKNPYHPSVYGVGYLGVGNYRASEGRKHLPAYKKWQSMIERCYSEKYQTKKPSYIGCTVDKQWHNFQNFADWFYSDPRHNLGYELDKDVLIAGNKIYSSKTCALVPSEINIFAKGYAKNNGLPIGVGFRNGSYSARVYKNGKSQWIGSYSELKEAVDAYASARNYYARKLSKHWKNKVSYAVYMALANWNELNNSKMVDGKFEFDDNGKIAKPDSYSKPDLTPFISTMQNLHKGGDCE